MGTNKKFDYKLVLNSDSDQQISHLALEAARIAANRHLRNNVGREKYFLRILVYPHHIVREHKMMAFAGADRLQDGMRKAFGKPFGTAARIRRDQRLISVKVDKMHLKFAERVLELAHYKFPKSSQVTVIALKDGKEPF